MAAGDQKQHRQPPPRRRRLATAWSAAAFARYVAYSQLHCLWMILKALVTGEAVTLNVTRPLADALGAEFYRSPTSEKPATGRVMCLANHRSWADFVIDSVLTNGGSYLARWAVVLGIPMSCLYGWLSGSVIFFRRRRGLDRGAFRDFLKRNWDHRPHKPLIVYPEGTRNLTDASLKLKTGALQAAYELGVPIQVVITANKEQLINEKQLQIGQNVKLVITYSRLLYPANYDSFSAWKEAVQALWDETWQQSYGCADTDAQPFEGEFFQTITTAKAEPVVASRAWTLRAIFVATGIAYIGRSLLKRLV